MTDLDAAWEAGPPLGIPTSPGYAPLFCRSCARWSQYAWGGGGFIPCPRCGSKETIAL